MLGSIIRCLNMIGKKFRLKKTSITIELEIIGETLTHYYVRSLRNGHRWNASKKNFLDYYYEIN